jgi:hypothetical protein
MRFKTMHSCTMTIIALAGNGMSQTVPAFIKAVCAKHETEYQLTAAPLPDLTEGELAAGRIACPQWELVMSNTDMAILKQLAKELRAALLLLPVDLCTEEE